MRLRFFADWLWRGIRISGVVWGRFVLVCPQIGVRELGLDGRFSYTTNNYATEQGKPNTGYIDAGNALLPPADAGPHTSLCDFRARAAVVYQCKLLSV